MQVEIEGLNVAIGVVTAKCTLAVWVKSKIRLFCKKLPFIDNVPLSGGLFNREVYLEGLKRRSEALHPPSAGKMTCNIQ